MNLLGWALAATCASAVLYGLSGAFRGEHLLSVEESAVYNALHRSVWGAAVCWVIFACATGNGGLFHVNLCKILHTNQLYDFKVELLIEVKMFLLFAPGFINTLLSWSAFVPLSRLTYASYLVHLIVMYVFNLSRTRPFYVTDYAQVVVTLRTEHSC